jgi:hypothetical protein
LIPPALHREFSETDVIFISCMPRPVGGDVGGKVHTTHTHTPTPLHYKSVLLYTTQQQEEEEKRQLKKPHLSETRQISECHQDSNNQF